MLLAAAPYALKESKDKRGDQYRNVVNMMDEVFTEQDKRLQERIAEKQALVDGADAQQNTLNTQKQNVESKLEANQVDLEAKRDTKKTKKTALSECEGTLKQATEEMA